MKKLILALVLMPVLASAGVAQAPELQMQQSIQAARESGVPVELLESKIAEGRAKGVPAARIAAAVERRLEALQRVQSTIDRRHGLTTAEMGIAADAFQAGVSGQALSTLAAAAPRERRAVAIATLAQLVQLGQASDVALRNVTAAMNQSPEALMGLPAQAAAAAGRRGPPAGVPAAGQAGNGGRGGPPPGVPATGKPPKPPGGKPGG